MTNEKMDEPADEHDEKDDVWGGCGKNAEVERGT